MKCVFSVLLLALCLTLGLGVAAQAAGVADLQLDLIGEYYLESESGDTAGLVYLYPVHPVTGRMPVHIETTRVEDMAMCAFRGSCELKNGVLVCANEESAGNPKNVVAIRPFNGGVEVVSEYKGLCSEGTYISAPYMKAETSFMAYSPRPAAATAGQQNFFGRYRAAEKGVSGGLELKQAGGGIAVEISGGADERGICYLEGMCVQKNGSLYCTDDIIQQDPKYYIELKPVKNG
ncbi:MAG: hypothetical protein Q4F72_09375, partial [Desulfovibrionaceae bacterium]|nr:hypothetical protein [Desulfovibrionaceae bacterium]